MAALVLGPALVSASASSVVVGGVTYVVNSSDDVDGGSCDTTHCSLREAIKAANATAGTDSIAFAIGTGHQTIGVATNLPMITEAVVIDGTTQPGHAGTPIVEITGTAVSNAALWLSNAGSSQVKGLVINGGFSRAILVQYGGGHVITGNFLGTNAAGTETASTFSYGSIGIQNSADNVIGGASAADRNVISSTGTGVHLSSSSSAWPATRNLVQGNFIGTTADGSARIAPTSGEMQSGVLVSENSTGGADGNTITGNVIASSTSNSIQLDLGVTGNAITRNHIGTDVTGTVALPSSGDAIKIYGVDNIVGGADDADGNVIGGRIALHSGASGNIVQHNSIGTDPSGTHDLHPTDSYGVEPNGGSKTLIADNLIKFVDGIGVQVIKHPSSASNGNTITQNSITSNENVGISLSGGGNNSQAAPAITSAEASASGTAVVGSLTSTASRAFRVEVFDNTACDPSGAGEGETFLGSVDVTTDASGVASINGTVAGQASGVVTATATDLTTGDTSPFSTCVTASVAGPAAYDDRIVYSKEVPGNGYDLWTIDPDGSDAQQLTSEAGTEDHATWSPDGTRIAYVHFTTGTRSVRIRNADGSGSWTEIYSNPSSVSELDWSPDGSRILFGANSGTASGSDIYMINVDDSGLTNLSSGFTRADGKAASEGDPVWSPGSDAVVFNGPVSNADGSAPNELFLLTDLSGTATTFDQLTATGGTKYRLAWHPDGAAVTYGSSAGFKRVDVSTKAITSVGGGVSTQGYDWAEDGIRLVDAQQSTSTDPGDLFVRTVGTASNVNITNDNLKAFNPEWIGGAAAPANSAPGAVDDSYSTSEDVTLNQASPGVLANDTDADSDPLTAVLASGTTNGTLTLKSNGSFVYTPDTGYVGADSFTYKASDGTASSSAATVTITVAPAPNAAPAAEDDSYSTAYGTALNVPAPGVLDDDTDADGDPLTAVLGSGPSNGTLTLNGNGSFSYAPDTGFSGADSFTYAASDGTASSSAATVTITVAANVKPTAGGDVYTVEEDESLAVSAPGVLGNDSDHEGSTLTATLESGPANGTATLNSDGSFTYTPTVDFYGTDTFTYTAHDGTAASAPATVTITVTETGPSPGLDDGPLDPADWNAGGDRGWCIPESLWQNLGTEEPCIGQTWDPEERGAITTDDGATTFQNTSSRVFPYAYNHGLLGDSGDFVIDIRMTFIQQGSHGSGFTVLPWDEPTQVGDDSPLPHGTKRCASPQVWSSPGGSAGHVEVRLAGLRASVANPGASHLYTIAYVDGNYMISVDGSPLLGPVKSGLRADTMWLGNPVFTHWAQMEWSDFKVESFSVSDGAGVVLPAGTYNVPTDATVDTDGDGLSDLCDADDDSDGITDIIEIWLLCDPRNDDTDGDGLDDGTELWTGTSPTSTDSDPSDGYADDQAWAQAQVGGGVADPNSDPDGDGVPTIGELMYGTDPSNSTTYSTMDGDPISDFEVVTARGVGTGDTDGDNLANGAEVIWGSDWQLQDSDGNGQNDVIYIIHSCPAYPKCYPEDDDLRGQVDDLLGGGTGMFGDDDLDGLSDPLEFALRTNAGSSDTDGDGRSDSEELVSGTPPGASLSGCTTRNSWDPIPLGAEITLCVNLGGPVSFAGGSFTGGFDWGDGTSDTTSAAGQHTASHVYAEPGVYRVTCYIEDENGARHEVEHLVVVYDPDGGFVTGGGWIDSPAGALASDPLLTGKANFGFVSKYKKGATVPTGNTEFQFKAGDLNFQSSSYEWLVVSGSSAKYKGVGTINGRGDYGFMVTATDSALAGGGSTDAFRIKIWDRLDGDAVVYDNKPGEDNDSAAATAISGGSIVIHKK